MGRGRDALPGFGPLSSPRAERQRGGVRTVDGGPDEGRDGWGAPDPTSEAGKRNGEDRGGG